MRRAILIERPGAQALIVALHGFGQRVQRATGLPGRLGLPFREFCGLERLAAHVLYPQAPGRNWRTDNDRDVLAVRDAILDAWPRLAPRRLLLFGFSDGGTLAHRLLGQPLTWLGRSFLWSAACVASGWWPRGYTQAQFQPPLIGCPVLLTYGQGETKVEAAAVRQAEIAAEQYVRAGWRADYPRVRRYRHDAAGHDWPVEQMLPVLADWFGLALDDPARAAPIVEGPRVDGRRAEREIAGSDSTQVFSSERGQRMSCAKMQGLAATEVFAQAVRLGQTTRLGRGALAGGLRAIIGFLRSLGITGDELAAIVRQAIAAFSDGASFDDVLALIEAILGAIDKVDAPGEPSSAGLDPAFQSAAIDPALIVALVQLLLDLWQKLAERRGRVAAAAPLR